MKLLVGHGLFDLATPYFASKIILDGLPAFAGPAPREARGLSRRAHVLFARAGAAGVSVGGAGVDEVRDARTVIDLAMFGSVAAGAAGPRGKLISPLTTTRPDRADWKAEGNSP